MDDLMIKYESLVYSVAKMFYGIDKEDLVQAGFLGLTKAYKNYNPNLNCKFSTYAYQYIYGEMYEAVNGVKPIKVHKDNMKLYKSVLKMKDLLSQKYGREVSYQEVCDSIGIDINVFMDILNSLSATIDIDYVELKNADNNLDDLIMLRDSLNNLSSLEKEVIEKRYMDDLSQTETAKILGLSQVKVSRLEKSSKEKMREYMAS